MSSYYLTTPIYYVNGKPHIGHAYTTTIADTLARYRRLAGDDVYFLTGTDEHGQKIARVAEEQGIKPIELADRIVAEFRESWERMGIEADDFIRTTEPRHFEGVKAIIERIAAGGDLYTGKHEGWYCTSCELFYTEKELESDDHLCPVHGSPAEWQSEENVFFRLSKYTEPLLELYRERPEFVRPESRLNEVRSFVEGGLHDLSVSRSNQPWGWDFPEFEGHTVYVWLDALTNYLSALGFGRGDEAETLYRKFWDGGGTRLHLVGKDILRFHAVYWPAFLMSAGLPLPDTVWAHGWWLRDEQKISKSAAKGAPDPTELIETFGPDPLRLFMLREMNFGQDASFSDEAFVDRYNSDLANDLGNTVSRVVTLSRRAFDGRIPPHRAPDGELAKAAQQAVDDYLEGMNELAFHNAIAALYRLLSETNGYLVRNEPWKKMKDPEALPEVGEVLWNGIEAVRIVATGLLPVMPEVAPKVLAAIGCPEVPTTLDALKWGGAVPGADLPETEGLFPRIDKKAFLAQGEDDTEAESKTAESKSGKKGESGGKGKKGAEPAAAEGLIGIDQFFETELKVATVLAAEPVPKSNKLLKLSVDVGDHQRTIVAGIAKQYAADDLVGKQVVIVANLQPAKLMGVESQGMVLAASVDGRPVVIHPGTEVPAGTRVR